MSTEAHVLVIVLAAAVIVFIVHLVRSRQLRAKYSVLWFSIGLALAVLAIFPDLLVELSDLFGIDYAPATFMLLALSFLLLLVLHFSWELSRLEDRTRALAEEHALLRQEFEERAGSDATLSSATGRATTIRPSATYGRPDRASSRSSASTARAPLVNTRRAQRAVSDAPSPVARTRGARPAPSGGGGASRRGCGTVNIMTWSGWFTS